MGLHVVAHFFRSALDSDSIRIWVMNIQNMHFNQIQSADAANAILQLISKHATLSILHKWSFINKHTII